MSYTSPTPDMRPKQRPPYMTVKQLAILKALLRGNADGSLLDIHQLIAEVAPNSTRGSMMSSLRHLNAHGLLTEGEMVKRRNRWVRTLTVTDKGRQIIRPQGTPKGLENLVTP